MIPENATFYCFSLSRKWKYEGRGYLPENFMGVFENLREYIIKENGGKIPGITSEGQGYILVIIPDDDHPTGWPLMFHPKL